MHFSEMVHFILLQVISSLQVYFKLSIFILWYYYFYLSRRSEYLFHHCRSNVYMLWNVLQLSS